MSEKEREIAIIPAAPGHFVLWYGPHGIIREPIVAWSIMAYEDGRWAKPICLSPDSDDERPILSPSGHVELANHCSWESENDWFENARKQHERTEAKKNAAPGN